MYTARKKAIRLIFILSATGVLVSCGKKGPEPETPNFRLFTNKMEITDATVRANFLKRSAAMFPAVPAPGLADKIVFLAPDTVTFGKSFTRFSVVRNNDQYLFYSPQEVPLSDKDMLIHDLIKYAAPAVPAPYLGFQYLTKEVRVGYGDAKNIRLPYIQYYWIKADGAMRGWSTGFLFNELNENIKLEVHATDTLAVRMGSGTLPVQ